ncbi:uncharacterized protein K489DRAFT_121773 [Dissoconium aciculare CBS 342.82]|uniref:Uncharacterized protein n=1 Tax=Dissoconium aciculare CBS 342.82 TaxID=1314786 RepID=A0A6J3MIA9_9PEZI|nr:uncharacterized protein K489DRAFT_121773 [Dissoconium aciculare CBS 342.82]KAF1826642.1 hypothetical protein K489DRAFT_121773 [Dissoconium aciculare CBS 342.82]
MMILGNTAWIPTARRFLYDYIYVLLGTVCCAVTVLTYLPTLLYSPLLAGIILLAQGPKKIQGGVDFLREVDKRARLPIVPPPLPPPPPQPPVTAQSTPTSGRRKEGRARFRHCIY